jgi:predicted SAM-dependent methyltransferase
MKLHMNGMMLNEKYDNIEYLYTSFGGGPFKIDLGCGYVKPLGFIGIDNLSLDLSLIQDVEKAPDILMDLDTAAFPFSDNSCEEVRSSHFLEHSHLFHILNESYRVLQQGGNVPFCCSLR